MNAVERLRRDHALLRSKLDVLESALKMGPETWYVLREVCFTLSRQLRDHIRREEELVAACRKAMNPKVLAEVSVEHHDEPQHLRTINRLFVRASQHSLEQITPVLTEVIHGLRRHMTEEERELFPLLERTLAEHGQFNESTTSGSNRLEEVMTVNCVIQQYPRTKPLFERLFINVSMKAARVLMKWPGSGAWKRGISSTS